MIVICVPPCGGFHRRDLDSEPQGWRYDYDYDYDSSPLVALEMKQTSRTQIVCGRPPADYQPNDSLLW